MAIYDLYGCLSADINQAKNLLEAALGIQLEAHDSSYQGGDYFRWGKTNHEHFILKRNIDPYDNEPTEMSFDNFSLLFYVNDTSRSVDLRARITQKVGGFVLLRHEDL